MKFYLKSSFLAVLLFCVSQLYSQKNIIACIGASMTEGANATLNYPFMLNDLLPKEYYTVSNLGVGGKTVTFGGASWVLTTDKPDSLISLKPNIVTILLGTNDCKVGVDDELYKTDYLRLIDSVYKWAAPDVKIYLCNLPPVFDSPSQWGHDNTVLTTKINPRIQEVATAAGLPLIDMYTPFEGHPEYMIDDGVHPNTAGYKLLSELMYDGIRKDITSISIEPYGGGAAEINKQGGFLLFDYTYEPEDATHTEFVWTLEKITGDAIIDAEAIQAIANGQVKVIASSPEGAKMVVSDEVVVTITGQPDATFVAESTVMLPYPNPTTGLIYIENVSAFESIEVFNMQGQKVLQQDSFSRSIDLSSLPNSTYLIKTTSKGEVHEYSVVKE